MRVFARRFSSIERPRSRKAGTSVFVAIAALSLCAAHGWSKAEAQTFDATHLREPADLSASWLVKAGDDPAYANPNFDDSHWTPFDPHSSIKMLFPKSDPELIWYRLRVKVSPDQTGLALREYAISRACEVYVNGEQLISVGQVAPFVPYTMNARTQKRIPDRMVASGSVVIALRVHISEAEWVAGQDPGYFATNLTIGQEHSLYQSDWLAIIGENAFLWMDRLMGIGLGIVALVLFAAQSRQPEYLWISIAGLLRLVEAPVPAISLFHNVPAFWQLVEASLLVATPFVMVSMYFAFVHQRVGWRWRIVLVLVGILLALTSMHGIFFAIPLPLQFFGNLPFILILSVVIPIVLAMHLRRGNREAGILLIPLLLFSLYIYAEVVMSTLFQIPAWKAFAIRGFNLIERFPAGPFAVPLASVAGILSSLSLAIIMLIRSTVMSRRQALLDSELAAAHEVQKLLVPEHRGNIPGFTIESVYEPAQQVGGDFFQIVPASEGGLVLVVGDVAGKGLPAAMLVSVIVGAICGLSEYTQDPAELLAGLNERLVGRAGGGFSTALAAHVAADGRVTLANAGHLPPYLDGKEVESNGALPLGVMGGVCYETTEFRIEPGSRLTFYSDGVIEAQKPNGELFGFERGRELSMQPAAAIAEAAKKFGQSDDITVVTIERAARVASAA
ncbi:MAG: SpoIIE family protein phosphatase [Terracidiphilus sp.]